MFDWSVSSDILACVNPLSTRLDNCLDKVKPLVVIPIELMVSSDAIFEMIVDKSLRSSGSPPVSRTLTNNNNSSDGMNENWISFYYVDL